MKKLGVIGLLAALISVITVLQNCNTKKDFSFVNSIGDTYKGDVSCKGCHQNQYSEWLTSDHFKSMQLPNDSTVLGNFNNAVYSGDGVTSTFFKKDGKFFINTQGDDGLNHDYEVKYTFGYYPLQQYLVAFSGGRLQATRTSWDSKAKKWFHQYAGQKIHFRDWLHWTGNAQNWNTMCAECHSTNYQKNYDEETDSYKAKFDVLNVSCEACHGPGAKHIVYINSEQYKSGGRLAGAFIALNNEQHQPEQINACMPCHAVKANIHPTISNSSELLDNYIPEIASTERFFADGQVKEEVYTYTSFLQSKMYARNVQCSNCHNPHSGKLVKPGNQACLQCHAPSYDSPRHHFHTPNTVPAECKSCHMPGEYFMGNDYRHDHSFRAPRPDMSMQYNTPNACNGCHKDKPFKWAAEKVSAWYGGQRKYHFAEDLIPGSKLDANSAGYLIKLMGDTGVPAIVKATAVHYLGGLPGSTALSTLKNSLKHTDAQVRYRALYSLQNYPSSDFLPDALPLLKDKARAVRIAAADILTPHVQSIPAKEINAFKTASEELKLFLFGNADFAHSNLQIADYFYKLNDFSQAEKYYQRTLKKDSLANLARINLATLYSNTGRSDDALQILNVAEKTDPANSEIPFKKGLLLYSMNKTTEAIFNFKQAVNLKSDNPQLYYNYGMALFNAKQNRDAIGILERGLHLEKENPKTNYALAFVYIESGLPQKAMPYAMVLKKLYPHNPDYQELFNLLNL